MVCLIDEGLVTILIEIWKKISIDLALRHTADLFFNQLELLSDTEITVSFSDVRSISRSFAHQYMLRKKLSNKKIVELNLPIYVQKMLKLVEETRHRSKDVLDLNSMQIITL